MKRSSRKNLQLFLEGTKASVETDPWYMGTFAILSSTALRWGQTATYIVHQAGEIRKPELVTARFCSEAGMLWFGLHFAELILIFLNQNCLNLAAWVSSAWHASIAVKVCCLPSSLPTPVLSANVRMTESYINISYIISCFIRLKCSLFTDTCTRRICNSLFNLKTLIDRNSSSYWRKSAFRRAYSASYWHWWRIWIDDLSASYHLAQHSLELLGQGILLTNLPSCLACCQEPSPSGPCFTTAETQVSK